MNLRRYGEHPAAILRPMDEPLAHLPSLWWMRRGRTILNGRGVDVNRTAKAGCACTEQTGSLSAWARSNAAGTR